MTLPPASRTEATALFSLMRNLGSSIGISVCISYLSQRTQINHGALAEYVNASSLALSDAVQTGAYAVNTPEGLMALNAEVTRQAATLAYLQDYRLMMFVTLAAIPLLLLLRAPTRKPLSVEMHEALD